MKNYSNIIIVYNYQLKILFPFNLYNNTIKIIWWEYVSWYVLVFNSPCLTRKFAIGFVKYLTKFAKLTYNISYYSLHPLDYSLSVISREQVYGGTAKYRMNLSTAKDKFAYDNELKIGSIRISELAGTIPVIYSPLSLHSNAHENRRIKLSLYYKRRVIKMKIIW